MLLDGNTTCYVKHSCEKIKAKSDPFSRSYYQFTGNRGESGTC